VPGETIFRYAIRISSEIMESNGSTSMASVCGGMARADGRGCAGEGNGRRNFRRLVTEHSEDRQLKRYELLTDIIRFGRSFRGHGFQTLRYGITA